MGGGRCPSDKQEARRRGVQPRRPGASAPPPGRQKVRAAPGREEARLPRRAALGRPPVPTHGLGQSLTGGEATDSRRLRQRRGSGSSAGSCRSGRRARSIPAPTTPPPRPAPRAASAAAATTAAATAPARERGPARGNDGESESARPVATAAYNLRLPRTAHARSGAGRGRARRGGRGRTQKVWPRLRPAHPRGRRPSGLRRCRWPGSLQVSSSFPAWSSETRALQRLGSLASRLVVSLAPLILSHSTPRSLGSSVSRLFRPWAACILSP